MRRTQTPKTVMPGCRKLPRPTSPHISPALTFPTLGDQDEVMLRLGNRKLAEVRREQMGSKIWVV